MPDADTLPQPRKRTRTIGSLTEEQLRNKRLVDRKAQRAYRQRSKDCMSKLVALQDVCREKDRVIEELRGRNSQLLSHLQQISRTASAASRLLQAQDDSFERGDQGEEIEDANGIEQEASGTPAESPAEPSETQSNEVAAVEYSMRSPSAVSQAFGVEEEDTAETQSQSLNEPEASTSHQTQDHDTMQQTGYRLGTAILEEAPASSSSHATAPYLTEAGDYGQGSRPEDSGSVSTNTDMTSVCTPGTHRFSVFGVLPHHSTPTCPLDHILADFRKSRYDLLSRGLSSELVVGPQLPNVGGLFDDEHAAHHAPPLSRLLSEVLSTFPHPRFAEKLAFFYVMYQTMKWLLCPTKENYDSMPTWLRPTVTQITVPHAPWIDNIPWPEVRDVLIEEPEKYSFETFSEIYSTYVRINWAFEDEDTVCTRNGGLVPHSIFLKHVRNLKNWTVSHEFLERFPRMTTLLTLQEQN